MNKNGKRKDQNESAKDLIDKSDWFVLIAHKKDGVGMITKEADARDMAFATSLLQKQVIHTLNEIEGAANLYKAEYFNA